MGMRWFLCSHLPPHLQDVVRPFTELAAILLERCEDSTEREVALLRLLEAKDAAVRATIVTVENAAERNRRQAGFIPAKES